MRGRGWAHGSDRLVWGLQQPRCAYSPLVQSPGLLARLLLLTTNALYNDILHPQQHGAGGARPHGMEYYTAMKKSNRVPHPTAWLGLRHTRSKRPT